MRNSKNIFDVKQFISRLDEGRTSDATQPVINFNF